MILARIYGLYYGFYYRLYFIAAQITVGFQKIAKTPVNFCGIYGKVFDFAQNTRKI